MKKWPFFILKTACLLINFLWLCRPIFAGEIIAWGDNCYGQCDAPSGNNFVAIANRGYHSLALRSQRSNAVSDLSQYQKFDTSVGKDVIAIARGVYRGIAFISEPVVLLVLGLATVVLFWKRQKVEQHPKKTSLKRPIKNPYTFGIYPKLHWINNVLYVKLF